jgi:hypothetical protein
VRETLALAQQMDLVIGPETGVLNAVCYEAMPKVAMLSHSSWENLTRHWVNTYLDAGQVGVLPLPPAAPRRDVLPAPRGIAARRCASQGVDPGDIYKPIDSEYTAWAKVQMLHQSLT